MAVKEEKTRIEIFGPTSKPVSSLPERSQCDESVLRLARLIGRQMAREQFRATHKAGRAAKHCKS